MLIKTSEIYLTTGGSIYVKKEHIFPKKKIYLQVIREKLARLGEIRKYLLLTTVKIMARVSAHTREWEIFDFEIDAYYYRHNLSLNDF